MSKHTEDGVMVAVKLLRHKADEPARYWYTVYLSSSPTEHNTVSIFYSSPKIILGAMSLRQQISIKGCKRPRQIKAH